MGRNVRILSLVLVAAALTLGLRALLLAKTEDGGSTHASQNAPDAGAQEVYIQGTILKAASVAVADMVALKEQVIAAIEGAAARR